MHHSRALLLCATFVCHTAHAALNDELTSLIEKRLPHANVGMMVMDAETGQTVYHYHSDHYFRPASNVKLFTAAAALYSLGANYTFNTEYAWQASHVQNGILNGNLYVIATGDPSLSFYQLNQMAKQLKQAGINSINGHIIVDDYRFEGPAHGEGWSVEDLSWYFAPPIIAATLDENYLALQVIPAKHSGGLVTGKVLSKTPQHLAVTSTATAPTAAGYGQDCDLKIDFNETNAIHLSGCWPLVKNPGMMKAAIRNPLAYFQQGVMQSLKNAGIAVNGRVKHDVAPLPLSAQIVHRSAPLSELLQPVLARSNNLYAENVARAVGYQTMHHGSFSGAMNAFKSILAPKTGINFAHLRLRDGSGASQHSLVTPEQFTKLLYSVYHSQAIRDDFMKAMAISGIQGSIRHRMSKPPLAGKVFAKTGTLTGVANLSGYVKAQNGRTYIFSILTDHNINDTHVAKHVQDLLVERLAKTTG